MTGKGILGCVSSVTTRCLSRMSAHLLLIFLLAQGVHVSSNGGGQSRPSSSATSPGVSQRASSGLDDHNGDSSTTSSSNGKIEACPNGESWCSSFDGMEKLALEAIRSLHRQLDDDNNGNIDLAESDEFLREELKYEKNVENRQKAFHRDDDNQVSVRELWESWVKSEVHNWTIDQTVEWLSVFVGLPKHKEKFLNRSINGTVLPILAVNHNNFLTSIIGIKDSITKQKIAVKAMDVVLFGPPRDTTNYLKDAILTSLLAIAVIACYLVYKRYQSSQDDLSKMAKHMEELSKAEESLLDLQKELEKARTDQEMKEKELKEAAVVQRSNIDGNDPDELIKLRDENMVLRSELHRAEVELQDKCWVPPPALQHWLQYTYEVELKTYNKKKNGAERQLKQAKDACDKLKKKRSSLMGAFVSTHGRSIDDVDKAILEARTSLTEITLELQERMHRWKQIEMLVGCPIMNNPGLPYLENTLKVYGRPQAFMGPGSVISNSQDDMDDDGASSIYCPSAVSGPTSNIAQMSMARSKSVTSMLSLRDRGISRESSSKDSSTGEEEVLGEASDVAIAKDRRVTFRADRRNKMKAFSNGFTEGALVQDEDLIRDKGRRVLPKIPSYSASLENSKPEEGGESELQKSPVDQSSNSESANGNSKNGSIKEGKILTNGTSEASEKKPEIKLHSTERSKFWSAISNFVGHGHNNVGEKKSKSKSMFSKSDKHKDKSQEANGSANANGHVENVKKSKSKLSLNDKNTKDKVQDLNATSGSFTKKPRKFRGFFPSFRRKGEEKLGSPTEK